MNNRVGTPLSVEEYENINMMIPPKFKKGGLAVLQERFNEYMWVMVLGENKDSRKIKIINDINNDPIEVFRHKLMNYPEIDTIEPISDGRMNLSNKDVIEIYELK
jgi:F420-0:gamma-glutamyl ligase-like protein